MSSALIRRCTLLVDTLIASSRKPLEHQIDRELQVLVVDLETLRPPAPPEQQPPRLELRDERLREPATQHPQRLRLPRRIRPASEHDDLSAGHRHLLHAREPPRSTDLQNVPTGAALVRPDDDVRHRELRHHAHRFLAFFAGL